MATGDGLAKLDGNALATIRSISHGSDDLVRQVVASFADSTPTLLQDIEAGLSGGDVERMRVAAHTLKSSAASLGASALCDMARRLELAARAGRLTSDLPSIVQLKGEFEAVCRALESTLNGAAQ